jgi:hypothetical protein
MSRTRFGRSRLEIVVRLKSRGPRASRCEKMRAGPKPSTASPPHGAAAKRYRGARLPGRRADRSQRSPRDSSVTGPSFSPTEAGERLGVPVGPSPKRRSSRRCRTVPTKAGVARRCRSALALARFERLSTQASAEALFWTRRVSARELPEGSGLTDRRRAAARGRVACRRGH